MLAERGAVIVDGLSKRYVVRRQTAWALRDVSFVVPPGVAFGIIGPNGSGKTTLLKLLARITPPTEGRAALGGRVAPMIELASALLQPELTGIQNVHLLAQLFGVPRRVADRRMNEIIEFVGLESLADAQAKTYSSGQYRRLAFSVALNLEPNILLADEVLAVGDAGFRLQCFERVEAANRAGLTVLFASHDMEAVRRLCSDVVWLDAGRIIEQGPAAEVTERYEATAARPKRRTPAIPVTRPESKRRNFNEHIAILAGAIFAMDGLPLTTLRVDEDALISISLDAATSGAKVRCVVVLSAPERQLLRLVQPEPFAIGRPGLYTASVHLPSHLLRPMPYVARIGAWVTVDGAETAVTRSRAFSVQAYDLDDPDDDLADDDLEAPSKEEITDLAWTVTEGSLL